MNLHPVFDRIIVKRDEAEQKMIIMPGEPEKPTRGEIVAAGPGRLDLEGNIIPMRFNVGDRVLFGSFAGVDVTFEEEDFLFMKEEDIMAVIS